MRILVGYKTNNEQTRAYRIVAHKDGVFYAHTFMVMERPWDGSKYLSEGVTKKLSGLKNIREEELEEIEE